MKMNIYQNLWDAAKEVYREFIGLNTWLGKKGLSAMTFQLLPLKNQKKKEKGN